MPYQYEQGTTTFWLNLCEPLNEREIIESLLLLQTETNKESHWHFLRRSAKNKMSIETNIDQKLMGLDFVIIIWFWQVKYGNINTVNIVLI